jgi:adenylate cyclase
VSRLEFEYEIPLQEAEELLDKLCEKPLIEKIRYRISYGGLVFEIDEFRGENDGLILAEVELEFEDQPFEKPSWLGEEVSDDPRYFNSNLVKHPFEKW